MRAQLVRRKAKDTLSVDRDKLQALLSRAEQDVTEALPSSRDRNILSVNCTISLMSSTPLRRWSRHFERRLIQWRGIRIA